MRSLKSFVGLTALLAALSAPASAQLTLTLDNGGAFEVVRPAIGSTQALITGTITLDDGWVLTLAQAAFPHTVGGDFLVGDFTDDFKNFFLNAPPGADYTGSIAFFDVSDTTPLGLYDKEGNLIIPSTIELTAEFVPSSLAPPSTDVPTTVAVAKTYSINVTDKQVIPEPGTLALLAVPAFISVYRRKNLTGRKQS
jgi:hypothetical protein